jgi:hypothetical protein
MEITINLPESVLANLSVIAGRSRRRIDEVIVEKIEHEFAVDAETMEKQISLCSDNEVLEIAKTVMPARQDARLSELLDKQAEETLTTIEQNELWSLMELNRLTTLKKAFAFREISRRGLNGQN